MGNKSAGSGGGAGAVQQGEWEYRRSLIAAAWRHVNRCAKEPYIRVKETYITVKEPYIIRKVPRTSAAPTYSEMGLLLQKFAYSSSSSSSSHVLLLPSL